MIEKTVLITGASGLLGRAVFKHFKEPSIDETLKWKVIGLYNSRARDGLVQLDLTNNDEVLKFITENKPDVIIHCAAEKRVENVEKNFTLSANLNIGATENLAKISAEKGIKFIYISTDYVFDGSQPPYKIDSKTNPLNKYAETKLEGEKATLKHCENHCVVRVPVLYGHTEKNSYNESAINILINAVRKGETYSIDDAQVRHPTHVVDVARFCKQLLTVHLNQNNIEESPVKGIFHCSAHEPFTKFEMSCHIADVFNLTKAHIVSDKSAAVQTNGPLLRPMNPKLCTDYTNNLLNYQPIMKFKESIKDCLENFV